VIEANFRPYSEYEREKLSALAAHPVEVYCACLLPEGLEYISSWVSADGGMDRCFQLMQTSDPALFDVWLARWNDLVSFEVYPVISTAEAAARTGTQPPDPPEVR